MTYLIVTYTEAAAREMKKQNKNGLFKTKPITSESHPEQKQHLSLDRHVSLKLNILSATLHAFCFTSIISVVYIFLIDLDRFLDTDR